MIPSRTHYRNVYACGRLGIPQPSRTWCNSYADPHRTRVGILRITLK